MSDYRHSLVNYDFEANTWNARVSSIGQERQFDSQSAVKQASSPVSEAITASNIKNIKFEIRNNKLDQLEGMSANIPWSWSNYYF